MNGITDMAVDKEGYLWATSSGGVARWNLADHTCTRYAVEPGLRDHRFNSVAAAPDGTLWFGTADGVAHFDGTGWTTYGYEDGLPSEWFRSIFVAPDGAVWAGTLREGVARFDGQTWMAYTEKDGLVDDAVMAIAAAPDGAVWFGTCGLTGPASPEPPRCYGVSRFDGQSWTTFTEADGLGYNRVSAIAVAADGALWFATLPISWEDVSGKGGVSRFDGAGWLTFNEDNGLASNLVYAIAVAPDGALWFGTAEGVSRYDGAGWTTYTEVDGLADNQVNAITVAPDGALLFGTASGVSRFDGQTWETYAIPGPAENWTQVIAVGNDGVLWASSGDLGPDGPGKGVSRFDGQTWTNYTAADGLGDNTVLAMAIAPDNTAWFATGNSTGVTRFDGQTWTTFTTQDGLVSDDVYYLALVADGSVWASSSQGASRFDGAAWTSFNRASGMLAAGDGQVWFAPSENLIVRFDGRNWTNYSVKGQGTPICMAAAPNGTVWVGNYSGAWHFDGQNWTRYTDENGLPGKTVYAVAAAPDGVIWFGTDAGAARFDGTTWLIFTREDGLVDDVVVSIAVAPDGAVWFGTYQGISRYLPPD